MKGLFIPGITAEMFRNGCLESIETLMAEGEIYDIDYEPEPQWIPCSERLPKNVEDQYGVPNPTVLFCTRQYVYFGWYSHGARCWWTRNGYLIYDVVAWMETPEPYKGEDDDEN